VGTDEQAVNDLDSLAQFSALASDDTDLELTCDSCGAVVCDIQAGDSLSSLADMADQHWQEVHGARIAQVITVTVTAPGGTTGILEAIEYALDYPQNYPDDVDISDWDIAVTSA
jgi:hypothetical protein